jgi:hypothetical protein
MLEAMTTVGYEMDETLLQQGRSPPHNQETSAQQQVSELTHLELEESNRGLHHAHPHRSHSPPRTSFVAALQREFRRGDDTQCAGGMDSSPAARNLGFGEKMGRPRSTVEKLVVAVAVAVGDELRHHAITSHRHAFASCASTRPVAWSRQRDFNPNLWRWGSVLGLEWKGEIGTGSKLIPDRT